MAPSPWQTYELEAMVARESYPGVVEIIAEYEQHCCEDDALAGRPVEPHCEED